MAAMQRSLSFSVLVFMLVTSAFLEAQARPFNIVKARNSASRVIEDFFDGLSLGVIKTSGPSPRGVGHKVTNSQTLGGIKEGPSPGEGHKFTNSQTLLGGIKEGPSPGEGHKFTNSQTLLGGIKDGPSPGEGHKFTNSQTLLGGIKDGPSPGDGHKYVTGTHH